MTQSSLSQFLGAKTRNLWRETTQDAEEFLRLLRVLFSSKKGMSRSRGYLVYLPPEFQLSGLETSSKDFRLRPGLTIVHPKGRPSAIGSHRGSLRFPGLLLVVIDRGTAVAILAERASQSMGLFRRGEESVRVLSSVDPAALREFFQKLRRSLGRTVAQFLDLWKQTAESPHFFLQISNGFLQEQSDERFVVEMRATIRDCLATTLPIELEGEPFFLALNRVFRIFLNYDYLELEIPDLDDFWQGHGRECVWRDMSWPGQRGSVILRSEALDDSISDSVPVVFRESSAARYVANPKFLKTMGLQSGVLMPLFLRSRSPGWLKLFFRDKRSLTRQDVPLLKYFSSAIADTMTRSRLYLRTQRLATIDGLTGLFNHRFFGEQLRKEFQRAKRYHNPLSLIMVDVDGFKQYNDANGHVAGDQALATLAAVIKRTVRDIDFVARYGGEEFALILPEVNSRGGLIVAEKVRRAVEAQSFEGEHRLKPHKKITISCGVCSNEAANGPEEMIELADQALYWVKRHGRNSCRLVQKVRNAK
jgi:diguanylate cyclase (GGDEF)-like protein